MSGCGRQLVHRTVPWVDGCRVSGLAAASSDARTGRLPNTARRNPYTPREERAHREVDGDVEDDAYANADVYADAH
eukprot:11163341-Lingulodinium_polyedra.AAC.1